MELNGSGEICSFAQEDEKSGPFDWQVQQKANPKMMVSIDLIGVFAILSQNVCTKIVGGEICVFNCNSIYIKVFFELILCQLNKISIKMSIA
jgi:hypothetical protein